jgi:cytidine deaminase
MNGKPTCGEVLSPVSTGEGISRAIGMARNPISADRVDAKLVELARQAQQRAYAPYSQFRVGAALLASDGRVFVGCNVENASLGATICAERVAACAAVSGGARQFSKLVVVTDEQDPVMPCGLCRQVLLEFSPHLEVVAVGATGHQRKARLKSLLPDGFQLKKPTKSNPQQKR